MAITLRSSREITMLRSAGSVVAEVLSKVQDIAKAGTSTARLDELAAQIATGAGGQALFKGVESPYAKRPFISNICA